MWRWAGGGRAGVVRRKASGSGSPCSKKAARRAPVLSNGGPGLIEIEADADLPPALVDPDRLHQVLMSLVSNAVKFSPPGSPVTIRVSPGEGSVEISVIDRRPGIEASELPGLFD
jgi:signal transduction histidine kinase